MNSGKRGIKRFSDWFMNRPESGIVLIILLFIVIATYVNPTFVSYKNILNILRASGFTLISTVGMALVLIIGGLDLSIGSIYAFSALVCAIALTKWNFSISAAILLGILTGVLWGCVNGLLVVRNEIPPMIATLGVQYIVRGLVSVLTKGVPIYPLPEAFSSVESIKLFGQIPIVVIIALVIAFCAHFMLSKTLYGRSIYAIGGNQEAARISGINIVKTKIMTYIIMDVLAAAAGILMSSRLGSAEPSTGVSLEMKVICAAVIGGVSVSGGIGTMLGAILGAFFMEALTNSLTVMRISVYWQNVVFGIILILSVMIDRYKRELLKRSSMKGMDSGVKG